MNVCLVLLICPQCTHPWWQLTSQHHDCDGVQLLGVRVGRHVTKANRNEAGEAKVQSSTVARLKQQLWRSYRFDNILKYREYCPLYWKHPVKKVSFNEECWLLLVIELKLIDKYLNLGKPSLISINGMYKWINFIDHTLQKPHSFKLIMISFLMINKIFRSVV